MGLKINIYDPKTFKAHRSGWGYVLEKLSSIHSSKGILFDDFIDITFGYNRIKNIEIGTIPYTKPWIGVLHHPPKICPWYSDKYKNSIDIHNFLRSPEFLISSEKCLCLIVLSDYLKNYLIKNFSEFKHIPIISIKHPTEPSSLPWNFAKFKKASSLYSLKILNIGYFLRNMSSIYLLKSNRKLDKYLMPSDIRYGLHNLSLELQYKKLSYIDKNSIKILQWQSNQFYDKLLEQSLAFLDLYDASCNNAIIECIVRQTPLLINRHPAIVEYIGNDYPMYYKSLEDANNLINYDSIHDAHQYLLNNSNQYDYLNREYFLQNFISKVSTEISITNNKVSKINKVKKIADTLIFTEPTIFNHRHGWPYVTQNLHSFCKKHNKSISESSDNRLLINNFTEHTFKHDIGRSKYIVIDNQKHIITRGYNLFSANNTDIAHINNLYYEWIDDQWKLTTDKKISKICEFNKLSNYKQHPWIGIMHNPVKMPYWFDYAQNIHSLLKNNHFIDAIQNCKLLITLSQDLQQNLTQVLDKHNINVPITNLYHPLPFQKQKFNFAKFIKTKNIIQVGYWLRHMMDIWNLNLDKSYNKIWLYGHQFASQMLKTEFMLNKDEQSNINLKDINNICNSIERSETMSIKNVKITSIDNNKYDELLTNSVVFINLYSASANNAVLECLSKAVPIIINKIPSVVEYLGEDYPLYYRTMKQASEMCTNFELINSAHEYLLSLHDNPKFSINNFLSSLYQELSKYAKNS